MSEKPSRAARRLEATAYHEAGHAVVTVALGRAVRRVSIIRRADDNSLGRSRGYPLGGGFQPDVSRSRRSRKTIEERVIIKCAGFHAESRFTGRRNHAGAAYDRQEAKEFLSLLAEDEELKKYLAWLDVRSKNLVGSQLIWRAIEYVARELLERKEITGQDVRRLYQQARSELCPEGKECEMSEFKLIPVTASREGSEG
jgi:hypothetical protein